jgi:hypothetical protein
MDGEPDLIAIGELSQRSGVAVRTLRFYADRDLVVPATRSEGGYPRIVDDFLDELLGDLEVDPRLAERMRMARTDLLARRAAGGPRLHRAVRGHPDRRRHHAVGAADRRGVLILVAFVLALAGIYLVGRAAWPLYSGQTVCGQLAGAPAGRVRVVADSQPLDVLLGAIGALGPASGR